jgi:hypothetical protein
MSEELEKAAKEYSRNGEYQFMSTFQQMAEMAFIAGANWQASNTIITITARFLIILKKRLRDLILYLINKLMKLIEKIKLWKSVKTVNTSEVSKEIIYGVMPENVNSKKSKQEIKYNYEQQIRAKKPTRNYNKRSK